MVNIQDKGDNIINFSITPARTVNSNQLNSSFENLISFFEQIKIFTSIKVTNLSKSFTKDNELISKVGEALKHGDKTKAGLLIDQALKKDFTNSTAWELLHNLIGQGKEFSKFQKEFTSRYYPDKSHLLDNK
ncbi:MAG: hypothetical protein JNJ43_19225 [Anaerolineales bacterium]|nr:hypothetical protein [Anaerolineales bacterium]